MREHVKLLYTVNITGDLERSLLEDIRPKFNRENAYHNLLLVVAVNSVFVSGLTTPNSVVGK